MGLSVLVSWERDSWVKREWKLKGIFCLDEWNPEGIFDFNSWNPEGTFLCNGRNIFMIINLLWIFNKNPSVNSQRRRDIWDRQKGHFYADTLFPLSSHSRRTFPCSFQLRNETLMFFFPLNAFLTYLAVEPQYDFHSSLQFSVPAAVLIVYLLCLSLPTSPAFHSSAHVLSRRLEERF